MIEQHLIESKRQIEELANQIMLNSQDLEIDKRMFATLNQKIENTILSEYLIDLANKRIEDLEIFISDEVEVEKYRQELIHFLRDTVRAKL